MSITLAQYAKTITNYRTHYGVRKASFNELNGATIVDILVVSDGTTLLKNKGGTIFIIWVNLLGHLNISEATDIHV